MIPFLILFPVLALAQSVLTGQYDLSRTGANTQETHLTQANATKIRKMGTFPSDGYVYGQPLIIEGVSISGATRVLLFASMANTIYLYNADRPGSSAIWSVNVGTPNSSYVAFGTDFFSLPIGCLPTMTVDAVNALVYAVCATSTNTWKLYSLNLADGTTHTAAVTIAGTSGGVTFDSVRHKARGALTLANSNVYVTFAGYNDQAPYQGWVFAYAASNLSQVAALCLTPSANNRGGIWESGGGMAVDGSGNLYVAVGDGQFDGATNFADSLVKLGSTLTILDSFTPSDYASLQSTDTDFGSGRPILTSTYVLVGGKQPTWFVLNQSSLGGVGGSAQSWAWNAVDPKSGSYAGEAFCNGSLYLTGNIGTKLYSFAFSGGTFNTTPTVSTSGTYNGRYGPLVCTSNGSTTSSQLIWMVAPNASYGSGNQTGTLRVFNAQTLSELYNSDTIGADAMGNMVKWAPPTVSSGRVYVPGTTAVTMFGVPGSSIGGSITLSGASIIN